ncbi:TPA: hypothetical protein ACJJXK_005209, partial [Enterobacter asburiae]
HTPGGYRTRYTLTIFGVTCMKLNGNIAILITIMVMAIIFGSIWHAQSKPNYVQDAVTRLSSYLSNYYGPTECSGVVSHKNLWNVKCAVKDKGKSFTFSVLPSDMAPYPVARSFYLKANDDESEEASRLGLMKYLQIDTFR